MVININKDTVARSNNDFYLVDTSQNDVRLVLPPSQKDLSITVKKIDSSANKVIISSISQLNKAVEGEQSLEIINHLESLAFIGDGRAWHVEGSQLGEGQFVQGEVIIPPAVTTLNALARYADATGTALKNSGVLVDDSGNMIIPGDLTVAIIKGPTTIIEGITLQIEDKNIELGKVAVPTNITADGGGITLLGDPDKSILWQQATNAWEFSEKIRTGNLELDTNTIRATNSDGNIVLNPDGVGQVISPNILVGNVLISGNTIASTDTDGDINLSPNGAGVVVLENQIQIKGGTPGLNKVLTSDANGLATWQTLTIGDVIGPATATNNALVRFDLATGKLVQNSLGILSDTGELSGLTKLDVDNIQIDGNKIISTNVDGDILLEPNGTGTVKIGPGAGVEFSVTGQIKSNSNFLTGPGAVGAPSYSFIVDPDTGMYHPATNALGFTTGGTLRIFIDQTGKVGIGETVLGSKLVVKGASNTSGASALNITDSNGDSLFFVRDDGKIGINNPIPLSLLDIRETIAGTSANLIIRHSNNTNLNSDANLRLITSDNNGGNPSIIYSISNVSDWSHGVDNADGDKFKISTGVDIATAAKFTIEIDGSIGIGTTNPDPSAILDISSTTIGFLKPRLTTLSRDSLTSPATGLEIYNSTSNIPNFYNGIEWMRFVHTSSATLSAEGIIFAVGEAQIETDVVNFKWDNTTKELLVQNLRISGNLFQDTGTVSIETETINVADNHINLNSGYGLTSAQTGGMSVVRNIVAGKTNTISAATFTAGVIGTTDPQVDLVNTFTYSTGDVIQISDNPDYNGLYEVSSHAGGILKFKGIGANSNTLDFVETDVKTASNQSFTVNSVNIAILRAGTDGAFEVANGNSDSSLTFIDLVTIPSGWVNDGTTVRLATITDSVGIGINSPDPSAVLDISSSAKGVALPRVSETARDAISSPVKSLFLYDETNDKLDYFNNSVWRSLVSTNVGTLTPGGIVFATEGHHVEDDPAQLHWDTTNNRMGIGTGIPISPLHIVDNSTIAGANTGVTIEQINISGEALLHFKDTFSSFTMGMDNDDDNDFYITPGLFLDVTKGLNISRTTGRVSIGNITGGPNQLNVAGDISTTTAYNINSIEVLSSTTLGSGVTSSSLTSVGILNGLVMSGTSTLELLQGARIRLTGGSGNNFIEGNVSNSGRIGISTDNTERITILLGGNVGINNITPSERLDVNGNIAVTGTVDGVDIAASINQDVRTTASPSFAQIFTATVTGDGTNGQLDLHGAQGGNIGGNINIQGGFGIVTAGRINITAGSTNSIGESVFIKGGDGPTGLSGGVFLTGGTSGDDDGIGGEVIIQGGQGGVVTGKGGDVSLFAGDSEGSGQAPGIVNIKGGERIGFSERGHLILQNTGGKIGIGLSNPLTTLQLSGNSSSTLRLSTGGTGNTGGMQLSMSTTVDIKGLGANDMVFYTNNTERIRILSSGNIGIGTITPNSTHQIEGSVSRSIVTKTAAYTVTASDYTILVDATSGNIPISLPTAVGIKGRIYHIKKIDSSSNIVTTDANATETLDGSLANILSFQNESIMIQSDNANWVIL